MSQQINLYNPLFRRQKHYFSARNMLQAFVVLLLGTALIYGYAKYLSMQQQARASEASQQLLLTQTKFASATARFGPRPPSQILQEQVTRMEEQAASRRQMLELMGRGELGNTRGFSGYLMALARQTINGVWLTGFRVVGRGNDMAINGRTLQPELVPRFIDLLKKEPVMAGQTFSTLEMKLPTADTLVAGKALAPTYLEFSLRNGAEESTK